MRPVGPSRLRGRAAALLLVCAALAAGTTFARGSAPAVPLAGAPDQAAADVLHVARNQLGDRYQWGGTGPDAWDCSGLTGLWRSVGGASSMPRVSRDQQAWAVPVAPWDVKRGDLVFFGHPVTHVGIVSGGGYMIDAGASRAQVVERLIWKSGVVRYGRVPRPGMPPVAPWTPPPLPSPQPQAPVADSPEKAAAAPRSVPAPRPSATPARPTSAPLTPLTGLPAVQKGTSSKVALKAVEGARSVVGRPAGPKGWTDVALVRTAWKHAGGGVLPSHRAGIVKHAKAVPIGQARVGDLVAYDRPDIPHLAVYLGHGYMVSASERYGKVVVRRVYDAPSVRVLRLG